MNTRFYNARILTMEQDMSVISGEIHVQDDKITFLGPADSFINCSEVHWDREIDAKNNLLMPGFKNAHTHSGMTFLRSYADDLPLQEWLESLCFPMEAKLKKGDVYHLSKLAILEYLTSGITSNFDMYPAIDEIAEASADCGFRTVLATPLNDFVLSAELLEEKYLKYQTWNPLISCCMAFHAEYTTSMELLKKVAELAHKYQAPVFTHNSETEYEVLSCIKRTGLSPTAYMDQLGLFEYGGGGYHCVHLNEEDMDIFKKRNMTVVTNPASNLKLASGVAPIQKMLDKGLRIALGTDGPASNNCLDIFREMFLVTGLAKMREKDAAVVSAEQVLRMAVTGSAYAMGLENCNCLAVGKKADMIMIDMHQPNMQPENHIVNNLVYSGSKQNVKMTMVNGKILYENGEFFVGEDIDSIYHHANRIIRECTE